MIPACLNFSSQRVLSRIQHSPISKSLGKYPNNHAFIWNPLTTSRGISRAHNHKALSAFFAILRYRHFCTYVLLALIHFMTFGPPAKPVQSLFEMVHLGPFGDKKKLLVSLWNALLKMDLHIFADNNWYGYSLYIHEFVYTLIRCPVLQGLFWYQNLILAKNALRALWIWALDICSINFSNIL